MVSQMSPSVRATLTQCIGIHHNDHALAVCVFIRGVANHSISHATKIANRRIGGHFTLLTLLSCH